MGIFGKSKRADKLEGFENPVAAMGVAGTGVGAGVDVSASAGADTGAAKKRMPFVAGNWKMNKSTTEAALLSQDIAFKFCRNYSKVEVALCPPFTCLKTVRIVAEYEKTPLKLGAQDVYWEPDGAFTGAISARMLAAEGVQYCIVGHSERREFFFETDAMVNKKMQALLSAAITPIVCVGEGLAKREEGSQAAIDFVLAQIDAALVGLTSQQIGGIVIAYEPIWAIGTGRTATPEAAQEMCASIRARLADLAGSESANRVRILYGGSMKAENAGLFAPMPDIDGGLIGGASLDRTNFLEIVEAFL